MSPRIHVLEPGWDRAAAARALAADREDPFFVFDVGEVVARLRRWRALLPRVEPFYAVKCNADPLLLRTLAALGAGFDCASRAEIELVTSLPVAPERIIFANPTKMASHMRFAVEARVTLTTFDCEEELHKIKEYMPHAVLLLRIRCDAARAHFQLGVKFGCEPELEAPRLLEVAAALKLDVAGVAFHIGSGASEPAAYARGVRLAAALCARAAALGLRPRLLDIGGGFQGHNDDDLQEVSEVINSALETHFPERGVRVIAEPGRYFAAAAYTLFTCIFAKRELPRPKNSEDSEPRTMYFMSDGVYGSFRDTLLCGPQSEPLLLEPSSEPPLPCSLWGPTLDGVDRVLRRTSLPPLAPGAWLMFRRMGAYTGSTAAGFNGFPLPQSHAFVDRNLWLHLKDLSPFTEDHFDVSRLGVVSPPESSAKSKEITNKMETDSTRIRVVEGGWTREAAARALAASREAPFFVLDVGVLVARASRWRALLPRVEPFYAVKCNADPLLLRTLAALGAGFDCASRAEIEAVINLPVAPERIIFAHPTKLPSHLRFAAAAGVSLTTFDSAEELVKIKQLMPNAQLLLRIRCDSQGARWPLGAKFGCEGDDAPRLLELAAEMDLDVAGIAFHVGSDTAETEPYARGVRLAAALCARAAALGLRPRLLDIGGGFQGHSHSDIKEVAAVINESLETHFPEPAMRVIAEPGRYFACAAYSLAACVFAKRTLSASEGREAHTHYFLNDGIYGTFMDSSYMQGKPLVPHMLHPSAEAPAPCTLWGPTCDALDCVARARLPPLAAGGWLLFRDHGAYSSALQTSFNGFPRAEVFGFVDRKLWSVLKDLSPFTEADFELDESEVKNESEE